MTRLTVACLTAYLCLLFVTPAVAGPQTSYPFTIPPVNSGSSVFGDDTTGSHNFSPASLAYQGLLRSQIPTTHITANRVILAGYRTVADRGVGATYDCGGSGDTSTGTNAIQDADGIWCNETFPESQVKPGWFGAYADDGATKITSSDISANPWWRGSYTTGESWDYVATQEAMYAAFAGASTPGSVVWNSLSANYARNYKLFVQRGKYGINHTLLTVAGFGDIEFTDNSACWDDQVAGGQIMWKSDSIAYFTVERPCLEDTRTTTPVGNGAPMWSLDHDGTYAGLATQQVTIIQGFFSPGGFNNQGVAISLAGGSAQGSTVMFIQPEFACFDADYGLLVNGANALGTQVIGGDFQGCTHDAIRNTNGSVFVRGTTFEDQETTTGFSPKTSQFTTNGADFHNIGDFGGFSAENKVEDIRSESYVALLGDNGGGNLYGDDDQVADGGLLNWFNNFAYLTGSDAAIVRSGVNAAAIMVDDGGPSGGSSGGWFQMDGTSTTTVLNDHTQSWTTNQWAGYNLSYRFSNGATFNGTIASNTATALTLTGSIGFTMGSPNSAAALYHIGGHSGGSAPSWASLAHGTYITNLNGSIGYGMSTTVGSPVVASTNLATTVSVGDYVVVPGADEICDAGNCAVMPLYGKVVTIGSNTVTLNKNAAVAVGGGIGGIGVAGYTGTPIADGNLEWIDLPFYAFLGVDDLHDSYSSAGFTSVCSLTNSGGVWANWNQGPVIAAECPNGSGAQNSLYGPTSRNIAHIASALTGTVSLAPYVLIGDTITATLAGSAATVTAPTTNLPAGVVRDMTFLLTTTGSGDVLTFGTGFNPATSAYTTTGAGEFAFRFVYNGNSGQWDELSHP
jgi:hypothetical protein